MKSGWNGLVALAAATAAAATTVATTTAAAATTAATAVATTAAATGAGTGFTWLGFIDGQSAAVMLLAVQSGDCRCCFSVRTHLDETKALRAAGFAILDDFGAFDSAVRGEQFLEGRAIDAVAQIPDV